MGRQSLKVQRLRACTNTNMQVAHAVMSQEETVLLLAQLGAETLVLLQQNVRTCVAWQLSALGGSAVAAASTVRCQGISPL